MINEPFNLRNDSVLDALAFGCCERTEKKKKKSFLKKAENPQKP